MKIMDVPLLMPMSGRLGGAIAVGLDFCFVPFELPVPLRWCRWSCSTSSGSTGCVLCWKADGVWGSACALWVCATRRAGQLRGVSRSLNAWEAAAFCIWDLMARDLRTLYKWVIWVNFLHFSRYISASSWFFLQSCSCAVCMSGLYR